MLEKSVENILEMIPRRYVCTKKKKKRVGGLFVRWVKRKPQNVTCCKIRKYS